MTSTTLWKLTFALPENRFGQLFADALEFKSISSSWHENPDNPHEWIFQALYEASPDLDETKSLLAPLWKNIGLDAPNYKVEEVPPKDWLKETYTNFPPLEIANFYIYGSHVENPQPGDRFALNVNAATAFGSGEHETTEGCLLAIHQLAQKREFNSPLDMGCGSGILAMAMAKTFGCTVLAVDNDPEAVKMTQQNAYLNNLDQKIIPRLSEDFSDFSVQEEGPYDIITANILAGPLCTIAHNLSKNLEQGGYVILSGLLNTQKEMVESSYRMANCTLSDSICLGDWTTLIMRKNHQ